MGVALGINLGGAFKAITDLATIVTRNSIAINTLASKKIVEPTNSDSELPSQDVDSDK